MRAANNCLTSQKCHCEPVRTLVRQSVFPHAPRPHDPCVGVGVPDDPPPPPQLSPFRFQLSVFLFPPPSPSGRPPHSMTAESHFLSAKEADRMIHICGASFVYQAPDGEVEALRRVDMDVASGEFCSVVGPSGCGKSCFPSYPDWSGSPPARWRWTVPPSAVPPKKSASCPSATSSSPGAPFGTT